MPMSTLASSQRAPESAQPGAPRSAATQTGLSVGAQYRPARYIDKKIEDLMKTSPTRSRSNLTAA